MKIRFFRIILFGLIALGNLIRFILIGTRGSAFQFIICLIIVLTEIAAYKDKKEIKGGKISYILCGIVAALIVLYISMFRYGFGRYVGIYSLKLKYADAGHYTTAHFPQRIPDGAKLTDMGHIPTIMQGSGYVYAVFEVDDPALLRQLEDQAASRCIMCFSGADYINREFSEDDLKTAEEIFRERTGFKDMDPSISVGDPGRLLVNATDHDIMIYILDSNFYWNHLRTDAVIVDRSASFIQYIGE